MNKQTYKKGLAIVLLCTMLCSIFPMGAAFATEPEVKKSYEVATLYADGTLKINNLSGLTSVPWQNERNLIKKVVFTVETPLYVELFSDCINLAEITLPSTITEIPARCFNNCTSLTNIVIPSTVTSIGERAFSGCTSLSNISIPSSVTVIGKYAFNNCELFVSVSIPNSVSSISEGAFNQCYKLESVNIPNSVTSIGQEAFRCCSNLLSIEIPNSVTEIGADAFLMCSSLKNISIPVSVISIGNQAFDSCPALTDIYYGGTSAQWKNINFGSSAIPSSVNIIATDSVVVSFDLNGHDENNAIDSQIILKGDKATKPTTPSAVDYTFNGWHTESACTTPWDFDTPVTTNTVLYAKWTENPAVHSHSYEGTYNTTHHWKECVNANCDAQIIDKAAHTMSEWTVTKEATTSETGTKERACGCGYIETATIEKLSTPSYTGGGYTPSTPNAEVTSPNEDVKITVKSISTSTLNDVKDIAADDDNLSVIGGKDSAVQISAKEDGEALESFVQPVSVTVEVSKSALKNVEDVNKLSLALVTTDEQGNTVLEYVGGNYDTEEGTFTAYTNKPGNYVLVEKQDIVKIELTIGSLAAVINGEIVMNDVAAYIDNDRTMVPVSFIMNHLGCKVDWINDERKVVITLPDGEQLSMIIDQPIPDFGAVPVIVNDRTMVPIAYIAYAMDAHVLWVEAEQRVVIVK